MKLAIAALCVIAVSSSQSLRSTKSTKAQYGQYPRPVQRQQYRRPVQRQAYRPQARQAYRPPAAYGAQQHHASAYNTKSMHMPTHIDTSMPNLGGSLVTDETPDEPDDAAYPAGTEGQEYTEDIANVVHVANGNPSNDRSWAIWACVFWFLGIFCCGGFSACRTTLTGGASNLIIKRGYVESIHVGADADSTSPEGGEEVRTLYVGINETIFVTTVMGDEGIDETLFEPGNDVAEKVERIRNGDYSNLGVKAGTQVRATSQLTSSDGYALSVKGRGGNSRIIYGNIG